MTKHRELSAGLLGSLSNKVEVERTLRDITSRASANAEGAVGVGLSIMVAGTVRSIGATTTAARRLDDGQVTDGDGPCLQALKSGKSVAVTDYSADPRWPSTSRRAAELGMRSSLSLPLTTRDDVVLGALNVYSDSADAFDSATGSSLRAFAAQATTSLFLLGELQEQRDDNAYLTEFSASVHRSLQVDLPDMPGLELVGESLPSAAHASVGGDWYDALVLPDGGVGLVIGDAMGHGTEAVTAMAQLRLLVRTIAWLGHSPDQVIAMTDQMAQRAGVLGIATLFFGRLTLTESTAQLEYCNAGHPQPLLRQPDGTVTVLEGGSRILLGALGAGDLPADDTSEQIEISPGSILLLYTDGVVERHGVDADDAMEQLVRALHDYEPSAPLAGLCERLLHSPDARDDATVFGIRLG